MINFGEIHILLLQFTERQKTLKPIAGIIKCFLHNVFSQKTEISHLFINKSMMNIFFHNNYKRRELNLRLPLHTLCIYQNNPVYMNVELYNKLPNK